MTIKRRSATRIVESSSSSPSSLFHHMQQSYIPYITSNPTDSKYRQSILISFYKLLGYSSATFILCLIYGFFMLLVGWNLHRVSIKTTTITTTENDPVSDPPWWLEDTIDDFFSKTYINNLHAIRKLNVSSFFTGMCGRYRFDTNSMPTASIIVTLQNEQNGMLTLTIHALLARTPPNLLQEIIIIDDNGQNEYRQNVNETELQQLKQLSSKIKILTNSKREGVARSRMNGARHATAQVLVFVDSHVEMLSSTWLQHLLLPIIENPKTVAAQTLDIINDLNWNYGPGGGDLLYGVINDEFWFAYQKSRFGGPYDNGPERETPGRRLPYETPFSAGSLFAIRRDRFFYLGGYDEGMYVWGGENTDFAIKNWVCGGRLVMVPCSRVGHMYRIHITDTGRWPPQLSQDLTDRLGLAYPAPFLLHGSSASNFSKITARNNIRVMERWASKSNAKTGYYKFVFGNEILSPEWKQFVEEMKTDKHAKKQRDIINKIQCKDFDWFDKHVFVKLTGVHHPWHPKNPGRTWV